MIGNSRRASRPMASRCGSAMRRSADDVALHREDLAHDRRLCGDSKTSRLELVEPLLELLDLRPVVVDHPVDDAVHQRAGPSPSTWSFRSQMSWISGDAPRLAVVNRDQIVGAEEEVGVVRANDPGRATSGSRCRAGSDRGSRCRLRSSGGGPCATASSTASGWKWKTSERIRQLARASAPARSTHTFAPLPAASHAGSSSGTLTRSRPLRWTKTVIMQLRIDWLGLQTPSLPGLARCLRTRDRAATLAIGNRQSASRA